MCSNMSACYSLLNFIMHLIKNSLGSNTCSNKVHQGYGDALGLTAINWAEILLLSLFRVNHPGQPSAWWTSRAWGTSKGHLGHSCHVIFPCSLSALCLVELNSKLFECGVRVCSSVKDGFEPWIPPQKQLLHVVQDDTKPQISHFTDPTSLKTG